MREYFCTRYSGRLSGTDAYTHRECLYHAAKIADRKSRGGPVDRNDPAGMDQIVLFVLVHDLVVGIVDLGKSAAVGIGLYNARQNDLLAGFEGFFHEGLVEPGADQHAALVGDHEFEDLDPSAPGLHNLCGNDLSHDRFIGADGRPCRSSSGFPGPHTARADRKGHPRQSRCRSSSAVRPASARCLCSIERGCRGSTA